MEVATPVSRIFDSSALHHGKDGAPVKSALVHEGQCCIYSSMWSEHACLCCRLSLASANVCMVSREHRGQPSCMQLLLSQNPTPINKVLPDQGV